MANDPGFELEFRPGAESCGDGLLSRPHVEKAKIRNLKINGVSDDTEE